MSCGDRPRCVRVSAACQHGEVSGDRGIGPRSCSSGAVPGDYRAALVVLVGGLVIGVLHMATSRALRSSSMPKDFMVYATALILFVFLLFRLPGIRERIDLTGGGSNTTGLGGVASLIVAGRAILTVKWWVGPMYTIDGINYINAWSLYLVPVGLTFVAVGLAVWTWLELKGAAQGKLENVPADRVRRSIA
jgi:hypothetical protein